LVDREVVMELLRDRAPQLDPASPGWHRVEAPEENPNRLAPQQSPEPGSREGNDTVVHLVAGPGKQPAGLPRPLRPDDADEASLTLQKPLHLVPRGGNFDVLLGLTLREGPRQLEIYGLLFSQRVEGGVD
jgi:hypothetical protein